MKRRNKALRRKLHLEWTEESFRLPVAFQPPPSDAVSSATDFLKPHPVGSGILAVQFNAPEAAA